MYTYTDSEAGQQSITFETLSDIIKHIEEFGYHGDSEGQVLEFEVETILSYSSTENGVKWFVEKDRFEVFEFTSGYFGICEKGKSGGNCIWGGDSAWEDCYSIDFAKTVFNNWDGTLNNSGNSKYGLGGLIIDVDA